MKTLKFLFVGLLVVAFLSACSNEDKIEPEQEPTPTPEIPVDPEEPDEQEDTDESDGSEGTTESDYATAATISSDDIHFAFSEEYGYTIAFKAEGGQVVVNVDCGTDWDVENSASDVFTAECDYDNSTLTVTAEQNTVAKELSGIITFVTLPSKIEFATITVTQDGQAYITVSAEEISVSADAGETTVEVESNYDWEYSCEADWLTITKTADGTGLTISYTANETAEGREAVITITASDGGANTAEVEITISQAFVNSDVLVLEYTITSGSTEIKLPICSVSTADVDWGDGSTETTSTDNPSHTYADAGTYTVSIRGTVGQLSSYVSSSSAITGADCLTAVRRWGDIGLTSMEYAFYKCTGLESLAECEGQPFSDVTTFRYAFEETAITTVPENLFAGCSSVGNFGFVFYRCYDLKEVPEGLFKDCTSAWTFVSAFRECNSLTTVPGGLFTNCTAVTSFDTLFDNCENFREIPDGLFANNSKVSSCSSAFANCTSLTSVSSTAFGDKPELGGISGLFSGCTSLTEIPEGLFGGFTKVSVISEVFKGCTNLKTIPASLFDSCTEIYNVRSAFYNCSSLECESPYTEKDGVKIHLYERTSANGFKDISNNYCSSCFYKCNGLTDYSSIPAVWRN